MTRLAIAAFLALAACEPPPDDVMPMAGGADGGVVAIQQAVIFSQRQVSTSLSIHFTYHPAADNDLTAISGSMEVSPSPYPETSRNHLLNAWHGYPDIGNISPVTSFGVLVATQDQNAPWGNRHTVAAGDATCTFSTAFRDNTGAVGISAVDCWWDSPEFTLVNNDYWISWVPRCKNGQPGNGWASEYISSFNDSRLSSYTVGGADFPNWIVARVNHGSPYYDRPYWQRMAQNCSDAPNMWSHPSPWHDAIWQLVCGGPLGVVCSPALNWDGGPYSWN